MKNAAFLTGSQVYGKTRPDSDIDLVILIDEDDVHKIIKLVDDKIAKGMMEYGNSSVSFRFGPLNLICCLTQAVYDGWLNGTNVVSSMHYREKKPIDKETACRVIEAAVSFSREVAGKVDDHIEF